MLEPTKLPKRTLTVMEGRPENYRLVEGLQKAATRKGWDFCHLTNINSAQIADFDFDSIPLDFVIFRELSGNEYYEVERVMEWLKTNHKIGINLDVTGGRTSTSDKHFQQGLFLLDPFIREYALPTYEAKTKQNVISYIESGLVVYPFVLKPRRGTTGDDIVLIRDYSDLDHIKSFHDYLIERYIEPECDWRVFVIGGVAVGAMRKVGDLRHPDNFKAWCAGRERSIEQDPDTLNTLSKIATHAAAISGLQYAGIDIIKEKDTNNFYLLETNIAASWSNFTPITHIDIPALTIDWLSDIADARGQSFETAIRLYLEKRQKYLPKSIQQSCTDILNGKPDIAKQYLNTFENYPNKTMCDAGKIFDELSRAYEELTSATSPSDFTKYRQLIQTIESLPLSWAGNFIGPNVGTFHDGAILTCLYLFLLHKITEV